MAMLADGMSSKPKAATKTAIKPKSTKQPVQSKVGGSFAMEGMGNYNPATNAYAKPGNASVVTPNPVKQAQRNATSSRSGSVYGGSPVSAGASGVMSAQAPAPAPTPMGLDQFKADGANYNKDASYMSEVASADSDYKNLIDQLTRQNTNYTSDFESGLRNMGLDWTDKDYASGNWDATDKLGSYGQAYDNTQNDFSGRGMLDSSFYGQAQQGVTDRFNRQRNSLMDGLNQENTSFAANKTGAAQAQQQAQQRAMAEAYNRYVAGFGV